MHEPARLDPSPAPAPAAGGERAWGPSPWFLVIAAGLVAGGLVAWWSSTSTPLPPGPLADVPAAVPRASDPPVADRASPARVAARTGDAPAAPSPAPVAAPAAAASAAPRIWRQRDPRGDQTPDLADYVNEGERPTMAEVIERLHAAGVHTGLGAFNPPGTRPPRVGLAVPEGFPLPEGYVRHYQATDDGQRIEAILMFAPDHAPVDTDGRPVAVPADRVVPPELAPPGLPIRRIVVPAPVDGPSPR